MKLVFVEVIRLLNSFSDKAVYKIEIGYLLAVGLRFTCEIMSIIP